MAYNTYPHRADAYRGLMPSREVMAESQLPALPESTCEARRALRKLLPRYVCDHLD